MIDYFKVEQYLQNNNVCWYLFVYIAKVKAVYSETIVLRQF